MSKPHQPPTQQRIDAHAAAIVVFVLDLARAIFSLDFTRRSLHRAVQRAERAVECMLLMMAMRLAAPPPQRDKFILRRNTPEGFARRAKRSKLLYKHARIRVRHGNFYLRLARLVAVMAKPELYVARFVRRLNKGLRGSHLVAVRPIAHALCAEAPLLADYADSS